MRWRWANVSCLQDWGANTKHLHNICTTSAQRLRRWSNIVQMLYKCFLVCNAGDRADSLLPVIKENRAIIQANQAAHNATRTIGIIRLLLGNMAGSDSTHPRSAIIDQISTLWLIVGHSAWAHGSTTLAAVSKSNPEIYFENWNSLPNTPQYCRISSNTNKTKFKIQYNIL